MSSDELNAARHIPKLNRFMFLIFIFFFITCYFFLPPLWKSLFLLFVTGVIIITDPLSSPDDWIMNIWNLLRWIDLRGLDTKTHLKSSDVFSLPFVTMSRCCDYELVDKSTRNRIFRISMFITEPENVVTRMLSVHFGANGKNRLRNNMYPTNVHR